MDMNKWKTNRITQFGGPEVLTIQSSPVPSPQKKGEVLVKVAFAGINPLDAKTRAGLGWVASQKKITSLG